MPALHFANVLIALQLLLCIIDEPAVNLVQFYFVFNFSALNVESLLPFAMMLKLS